MKQSIAIILLFCLWLTPQGRCEDLKVLFFHRPPYYIATADEPGGFLVDMAKKIFHDSDITPVFEELPPARIMLNIKKSGQRVCSLGWFKNKDREKFAKFSLPIYQNKPMVILTTRSQAYLFEKHDTIKSVLQDKTLTLAVIDSFSYGTYLDKMIKAHGTGNIMRFNLQHVMPNLIQAGRVSYMLIAPEEIDTLLASAMMDVKEFVAVPKPDIPAGNKRYIIFSKKVSDATIHRVNRAIINLK